MGGSLRWTSNATNPAKAAKSNLAGIAHVVSRMDWYCALSKYLLEDDDIETGDEFDQAIHQQLEDRIVALYKALLLYQMKSVCTYYRHQDYQFLRDLVNYDNWDDELNKVKSAEEALEKDSDQYNTSHARNALGQLLKHAKNIEKTFGETSKAIVAEQKQMHLEQKQMHLEQKKMHLDDKDNECLRDLFVIDPQEDVEKIENKKDPLLEEAFRWILDTEEYNTFTKWSNPGAASPSPQLMWLKGPAGTGKTMLVMGIIRELSKRSATPSPMVSYFFCQGTDKALNTATATLKCLVWQLLNQQPHLISYVREKRDKAGTSLFEGETGFLTLSKVFKLMLTDTGLCPVYFVIDALDECKQGQPELKKLISASLELSDKAKWLVSSRPEVELKTLSTASSMVELDAQKLEAPVNSYIAYKLSMLKGREGYDVHVLADVEKEVRRRANNTFLWVALAFKELEKEDDDDQSSVHGGYALEILREMPPGLSKLYDHMMAKLELGIERNLQHCKNVLVCAILAHRPLTLLEMAVLADLPPNKTEPKTIVKKCGSFLTVKEQTVYLIHQSAKDYLDNQFKARLRPDGALESHADLGIRSINAMSLIIKQNMYGIDYGYMAEDMKAPEPDPLAPIKYSCEFWANHFSQGAESLGSRAALAEDGAILIFLRERLLHWLESLSLLGRVPKGLLSIRELLHTTKKVGAGAQLVSFLEDVVRFIYSNGAIIAQAPLQTYGSALIFSPTTSEVRKSHWEKRLPFIGTVEGIQDHWGTHRQTLEGHREWITAIAFSPDGMTLATASADNSICLWDEATGMQCQTLEKHDRVVEAICFSPDGKTLASVSDDLTVCFWDMAKRTCYRTLEGQQISVMDVEFSPNCRMLATTSYNETTRRWDIDLWNAATGTHYHKLEGHNDMIRAVNYATPVDGKFLAFSPDNQTLATSSDDEDICLWDISTRSYIRALKGHNDVVTAIAFSPSTELLASAAFDEAVRLWDTSTGLCLKILKPNVPSLFRAIALSPDGKMLAAVADAVHVWDLATKTPSVALRQQGETDGNAITFSPNSETLVSGSLGGSVYLLDMTTDLPTRTVKGHSDDISVLVFSPDGETLISASLDGGICLWDKAGLHLRTFMAHSHRVSAIAFSPDGEKFASTSDDQTICLWNTTDFQRKTLEKNSRAKFIIFSPNSKMLASADAYDKTVCLWVVSSGLLRGTFELDSHPSDIIFSPDSKTLASISTGTVYLYNTSTASSVGTLDYDSTIHSVAFSPDSNTIASISNSLFVLYNIVTGTYRDMPQWPNDEVTALVFSPGGKTLASASKDNTVRLWDASTGLCVKTLRHGGVIRHATFEADGRHLRTNIGRLQFESTSISPEQCPHKHPSHHSLYTKDGWIILDEKKSIWLPSDCRPTSSALCGNTMALRHRSGRPTVLTFKFI